MTSRSAYFGYFGFNLDVRLETKPKMPKTNKIDEYLNSTYHEDIVLLPWKLKNDETDDFIAWKLGRKVIKASIKIAGRSMRWTP